MTTAVDIGGTTITAATVRDNKIVKKVNISTEADKGIDTVLLNIKKAISEVLDGPIGIGCPGPLDPSTGIIFEQPNLPFKDFNLKEYLEYEFKEQVLIYNDADCFTLGEAMKVGSPVVFGVTLGTGVGGGLVIGGEIFLGLGAAGEIFNMVDLEGKTIESFIGKHAIISSSGKDPLEIYNGCKRGDQKALDFFSDYGKKLGTLLSNIASFIDPHTIVVGGSISKANEFFHETAKETLLKYTPWFKGDLIYAQDSEESALLGAANLFSKETLVVEKPWGSFRRFTHDQTSTVKILTVEAGGRLSLQTHKLRDEFWVILDDGVTVEIDGELYEAKPGDEFFVKKGKKHRISAAKTARVLEISFGHFDEEDIIRYDDPYGRC